MTLSESRNYKPILGRRKGSLITERYGILMICDEVMVGFGRTGQLFGFQHFEGAGQDDTVLTPKMGVPKFRRYTFFNGCLKSDAQNWNIL